MDIRYSQTTKTFYPLEIDYGENLPSDVQTVEYSVYEQVMSRDSGTTFDIADGVVTISEREPDPYEPQRDSYLITVRATREKILTRITGIWVATDDDDLKAACRVARQNLLDITKVPDVVNATNMDDLKAAILVAYRNIVQATAAEVRTAFNGVDA